MFRSQSQELMKHQEFARDIVEPSSNYKDIEAEDQAIVVAVANWCPHCRSQKEKINRLILFSKLQKPSCNLKVFWVDCPFEGEFQEKLQVPAFPSFYYKNKNNPTLSSLKRIDTREFKIDYPGDISPLMDHINSIDKSSNILPNK